MTIESTINTNTIRTRKTRKAKKVSRKKKKAKTIKVKKITDYKDFVFKTDNDSTKSKRFVFKRMNTISPFSNKFFMNKNIEIKKTIEEKENNSKIKNIELNLDSDKDEKEKEKNKINIMKIANFNINKKLKDLLSYKYKPNIIEDLKEKSRNNKNNLKKELILNKTSYGNFKYKNFKNQISRNTQCDLNQDNNINNIFSLTEFTNLKSYKNRKLRFDSGKYNLPLIHHI